MTPAEEWLHAQERLNRDLRATVDRARQSAVLLCGVAFTLIFNIPDDPFKSPADAASRGFLSSCVQRLAEWISPKAPTFVLATAYEVCVAVMIVSSIIMTIFSVQLFKTPLDTVIVAEEKKGKAFLPELLAEENKELEIVAGAATRQMKNLAYVPLVPLLAFLITAILASL